MNSILKYFYLLIQTAGIFKVLFSLPEKPYIDQQTQEMSEMPEERQPYLSTESFCRDIYTHTQIHLLPNKNSLLNKLFLLIQFNQNSNQSMSLCAHFWQKGVIEL